MKITLEDPHTLRIEAEDKDPLVYKEQSLMTQIRKQLHKMGISVSVYSECLWGETRYFLASRSFFSLPQVKIIVDCVSWEHLRNQWNQAGAVIQLHIKFEYFYENNQDKHREMFQDCLDAYNKIYQPKLPFETPYTLVFVTDNNRCMYVPQILSPQSVCAQIM